MVVGVSEEDPFAGEAALGHHVIPDDGVPSHHHVLAKGAVGSNPSSSTDMAKMPNTSFLSNNCSLVDDGGGMGLER